MMTTTKLTIERAARLLQTFRISTSELSLYCYNVACFGDHILQINAFSHLESRKRILQQAKVSEDRIRTGCPLSILDGIPISIKANIAVEGLPFTASSKILGATSAWITDTTTGDTWLDSSSLSSSPNNRTLIHKSDKRESSSIDVCGYDSYVSQQLIRKHGAILIGLCNMDEFGMGSLGSNINGGGNDKYSFTKNPKPFLDFISSKFNNNNKQEEEDALYPFSSQKQISIIGQNQQERWDDIWVQRIQHFSNSDNWNDFILLREEYNSLTNISAGGSSCGSAASVALGSSLSSIGTDTGGSVRLPAAWCGIVGMKPTYGLISRHGVISYASSLDTVGVLSPSVSCSSIILDHLIHKQDEDTVRQVQQQQQSDKYPFNNTGVRYRDATAVRAPSTLRLSESFIQSPFLSKSHVTRENSLQGITVGIPAAFSMEECPDHIQQSWQAASKTLQSCGAEIKLISPHVLTPDVIKLSLPAYYILACAEASSNLARYDGLRYGRKYNHENLPKDENNTWRSSSFEQMSQLEQTYARYRATLFGHEVTRRVLCGTAVLSTDRFHSYYETASYIRFLLIRQFENAFGIINNNTDMVVSTESVDCILIPTAMFDPPTLNQLNSSIEIFANDILTVPSSLAGLPSISIPLGTKDGKKSFVGIQIIGPKNSEKLVLNAAQTLLESYEGSNYCV